MNKCRGYLCANVPSFMLKAKATPCTSPMISPKLFIRDKDVMNKCRGYLCQ
jgi:hypothetical protein